MYQKIIGRNIKNFRSEKELTQENLAEALGVSHSFISQLEIGKKSPSIAMLYRIANYLSVDPALLLLRQDLNDDTLVLLHKIHTMDKKYTRFIMAITKALYDLLEDEQQERL